MAGGFKSPAFWLGLSSTPSVVQGGFRTPIPGWNAGAVTSAPSAQGGYRSLQGFWIGGAAAGAVIPPPVVEVGGGGSVGRLGYHQPGRDRGWSARRDIDVQDQASLEQLLAEDEDLLLMIAAAVQKGLI